LIHAGLSKNVQFNNLSNIDPCTFEFYYS